MDFRYFIEMSYMGTVYYGWQIQPDNTTVQELTEKALSDILGIKTGITGAGRTDTGVHASYYVAHFNSATADLDQDKSFLKKLNGHLPGDIAISSIKRVKPDAHARFSATARKYKYFISTLKDPFKVGYSWYLKGVPSIEQMNFAAALLPEYDDFTSFSKLHSGARTNICKVTEAYWEEQDGMLVFTITADRFLRNMVRSIVGTLVNVGFGKINQEGFRDIIEAKDRSKAGQSAPAMGLYLTDVIYPEDIYL